MIANCRGVSTGKSLSFTMRRTIALPALRPRSGWISSRTPGTATTAAHSRASPRQSTLNTERRVIREFQGGRKQRAVAQAGFITAHRPSPGYAQMGCTHRFTIRAIHVPQRRAFDRKSVFVRYPRQSQPKRLSRTFHRKISALVRRCGSPVCCTRTERAVTRAGIIRRSIRFRARTTRRAANRSAFRSRHG